MKTYCRIPFEQELWEELDAEANASGKIILEDNETYVQLMPVDKYAFMPGAEQMIDIILNFSSQVALGLLINWLYDKIKQKNIKKFIIKDETYEVKGKDMLENVIENNFDKDE